MTIADIASALGVATSTVSRALSRPGRVSPTMRERVLTVARDLGYVPAVRPGVLPDRTHNIALFVPDITNPFFFDLIRGTRAQTTVYGYQQTLVDTQESPRIEAAKIAETRDSVAGIVLSASRLPDERLADLAREIPIVLINRDTPGVPAVVIDTPGAMARALEHLSALGHRSVAFVAGASSSGSSSRRWSAIKSAADRTGVQCCQVGPFPARAETGAAAADAVLTRPVSAALFHNDLLAIGAMRRLAELGVRVPDDLSVVGCDDIFGADFCSPPLTTVTNPIAKAGQVAVNMLLGALLARGSQPGGARPEVLHAHLAIRKSAGLAPGRDRNR